MRHSTATLVVIGVWAMFLPALKDSLFIWSMGLLVLIAVGRLVDRARPK
jgi:hypothetical protein